MSLDDMLSKLLDSLEAENSWDTEAYAQMALDYVDAGNTLSSSMKEEELRGHLNRTLISAKKKNESERKKKNLIEEIVNFKG